jgi:hypothetical protein
MIPKKMKVSNKWYYALVLCGGLPLVACIVAGPEKTSEEIGPKADTNAPADTNGATETNFLAGRNAAEKAAGFTEFEAREVVRSERALAPIAKIAPELRKVPNHDATLSKLVASAPTATHIANPDEGSLSVSLEK